MKIIVIALYIVLISFRIIAQEDPETPTSAPSKTPTIIPSPTNIETDRKDRNSTTKNTSTLENPFTQDDLQLLVGNVQRPNGIIWNDGQLYTVCNGDWTLYRIDDTTGSTITFIFGIKNGNSLLLEETNNGFDLWIPDSDSNTLWKVDQNRSAPSSINNQLITPWGIVRVTEDRFLITNSKANSIVEISENGSAKSILNELRSPTGMAIDDNYIYFANGGSARRGIEWFEILEDGSYSEPKTLISGLQNTTNVIMGQDNFLYFAYALGTRGIVGRINPTQCRDGGCTNEDVEIVIFSDIPAPIAGMTLSDDMRLFLHSRYRPEIYWIQIPNTGF
jgi:hypothetical protein